MTSKPHVTHNPVMPEMPSWLNNLCSQIDSFNDVTLPQVFTPRNTDLPVTGTTNSESTSANFTRKALQRSQGYRNVSIMGTNNGNTYGVCDQKSTQQGVNSKGLSQPWPSLQPVPEKTKLRRSSPRDFSVNQSYDPFPSQPWPSCDVQKPQSSSSSSTANSRLTHDCLEPALLNWDKSCNKNDGVTGSVDYVHHSPVHSPAVTTNIPSAYPLSVSPCNFLPPEASNFSGNESPFQDNFRKQRKIFVTPNQRVKTNQRTKLNQRTSVLSLGTKGGCKSNVKFKSSHKPTSAERAKPFWSQVPNQTQGASLMSANKTYTPLSSGYSRTTRTAGAFGAGKGKERQMKQASKPEEDARHDQIIPSETGSYHNPFTPAMIHFSGAGGQGTKLHSVEEIPSPYQALFPFPFFNAVQSMTFDELLYTDGSVVVSAPTGSGKTVLFELAMVRLLLNAKVAIHDLKIIYIGPMKSLCGERVNDWQQKLSPLGLQCLELTGDSDLSNFSSLHHVQLICTTPEKWDSVTRRWKDNRQLFHNICLVCIDEVHVVGDLQRGATLEAVITRMKMIQSLSAGSSVLPITSIRFVAVSATLPNTEDIAEWLSSQSNPASVFKLGEEYRPVKLQRVVLGYPFPEGSSDFRFDLNLTYKLPFVIDNYCQGKPTLVFCSSRKSCQQTAETLVKRRWGQSSYVRPQFREEIDTAASRAQERKLSELLVNGVGLHHAGLEVHDRKLVEELFRTGKLAVLKMGKVKQARERKWALPSQCWPKRSEVSNASLPYDQKVTGLPLPYLTKGTLIQIVCTSTLSVGVNLPAHLVIVKATHIYVMGVAREYSDQQVLQMIGRAGRPQFDTSATVVIMTKSHLKGKYEALVNGTQVIESMLHKNLTEHVNVEVVLNTITDMADAAAWLSHTLLHVRATKNPRHYGLPFGLGTEQVERKLQDLCMTAINKLNSLQLVSVDPDTAITSPTDHGRLMARYCMEFQTMKLFSELPWKSTINDLVKMVAGCPEFHDVQLRTNEKKILNALNKSKHQETIRYPMPGKIKTKQMKVNCLIQAGLGCLHIQDYSLSQDLVKIFRGGQRLTKCLMEWQWLSEDYQKLLHSIQLCKAFQARLWPDSKHVARQLEGIGPTISQALVQAGLTSFQLLEGAQPQHLELVVNRHPPFGNRVCDAVSHLPRYELIIQQTKNHQSTAADLIISVSMLNAEDVKMSPTCGPDHQIVMLIGDEDNSIVFKWRLSDRMLVTQTWSRKAHVKRAVAGPTLHIGLISQDWVGLDIHTEYQPAYTASLEPVTKSVQTAMSGVLCSDRGQRSTKGIQKGQQNKGPKGSKSSSKIEQQLDVMRSKLQYFQRTIPQSPEKLTHNRSASCQQDLYISSGKPNTDQLPVKQSRLANTPANSEGKASLVSHIQGTPCRLPEAEEHFSQEYDLQTAPWGDLVSDFWEEDDFDEPPAKTSRMSECQPDQGVVSDSTCRVSVPSVQPPTCKESLPNVHPPASRVNLPNVQHPACRVAVPSVKPPANRPALLSVQPSPSRVPLPSVQTPAYRVSVPSVQPPASRVSLQCVQPPACNVSVPSAQLQASRVSLPSVQPPASRVSLPSVQPPAYRASLPSVQPPASRVSLPSVQPPAYRASLPSVQPPASRVSIPSVQPPAYRASLPSVQPPASRVSLPSVQPPAYRASLPSVQPPASRVSLPSVQPPAYRASLPSVQPPASRVSLPCVQPPAYRASLPNVQSPASRVSHPGVQPPASRVSLPSVQPLVCRVSVPIVHPSVTSVTFHSQPHVREFGNTQNESQTNSLSVNAATPGRSVFVSTSANSDGFTLANTRPSVVASVNHLVASTNAGTNQARYAQEENIKRNVGTLKKLSEPVQDTLQQTFAQSKNYATGEHSLNVAQMSESTALSDCVRSVNSVTMTPSGDCFHSMNSYVKHPTVCNSWSRNPVTTTPYCTDGLETNMNHSDVHTSDSMNTVNVTQHGIQDMGKVNTANDTGPKTQHFPRIINIPRLPESPRGIKRHRQAGSKQYSAPGFRGKGEVSSNLAGSGWETLQLYCSNRDRPVAVNTKRETEERNLVSNTSRSGWEDLMLYHSNRESKLNQGNTQGSSECGDDSFPSSQPPDFHSGHRAGPSMVFIETHGS